MNEQARIRNWKMASDNRFRLGYRMYCSDQLRVQESDRPERKGVPANRPYAWTDSVTSRGCSLASAGRSVVPEWGSTPCAFSGKAVWRGDEDHFVEKL